MVQRTLKKFWTLRREILLGGASAFLILAGVGAVWAASLKIPDISSLENRKIEQSTKIYDRTGTILLDDLSPNVTRTVVPLSDISPNVQRATIAIEDSDFYQHGGIRLTSIIRAILADVLNILHISSGYTQGGSTITQQVVKNSILTTDRTLARKIKEWVLAIKLEEVLSKDKILELYLNESPYGGSVYGVEEASEEYFGIHAKDVDLAQAAYLAALPQAPTFYSPYGNHRQALEDRKNTVLARMHELKLISDSEYATAKKETVSFAPQAVSGIRAPHFVFYVREQLEQEFGEDALQEGGYRVITTLDADLEAKAEEVVKAGAAANQVNFNASNAAIVAIDPKTGDILTMAGSRNYFDSDIDGAYNIALAKRQPGSSFKPFVYAAAFMKGLTPATLMFDAETQFSTLCRADDLSDQPPCYTPGNYDNKFRGPISIRDALAQSINIPAIEALYIVGIKDALSLAKAMGVSTLTNPDQYGLTLVLGGGEVTLLDMTSAYGVFANDGVRNPYRSILKVEDSQGHTIKDYTQSASQSTVLDPNIARTVSDVLSDNAARIPEFGADSPLNFPGRHVADKTGTTNNSRDAWIIGYTPDFVAGAWAGNNDNTPMAKQIAGFIVAPLWHQFMEYALSKYPNTPFPIPDDLGATKPALTGSLPLGTDGQVHSLLYWVDKNDIAGAPPANPANDPQYSHWEWAVQNWIRIHGTPVVPPAD